MTSETADASQINATLQVLQQELARLGERVAALEAAAGIGSRDPGPRSVPAAQNLSEEVLLVISAATAAFLGEKAHVRQIRLLGAATWAQQGRVMIQASHDLAVRHG